MKLEDALSLGQKLIKTKEKHEYYEHVNKLREKYTILITGKETGKLLIQFVKREDKELFEQRERLTISITPAVCSSLMKPFNKVGRNNKIRKKFDFKNEKKNRIIQEMVESFYGRQKSKVRGLDYWLQGRYTQLQFCDPNAWVVVEWNTPASKAEIVHPRPFEVSSQEAWHFKITNEETKWLWVHLDIMMKSIKGLAKPDDEPIDVPGHKFTLYDEENTIVYTQVEREWYEKFGKEVFPAGEIYEDEKSKEVYVVQKYTPKIGYVPAFRVGYIKDPSTKGKTNVNGFHDALPYLMKTIKTVSEFDLTTCLHVFPQKFQYVQKCPGTGTRKTYKKCDLGYSPDGAICTGCKGTGYKIHTTAQDVVLLPLPETKEEMIPLDQLLHYEAPPIELLKFQAEQIDSLKEEAHKAVYNTTAFVRTNPVNKTATEVDTNMQGVYDTLEPFTEKVSEMWKELVSIFAIIAGASDSERSKGDVIHQFPSDFKLKSIDALLMDLERINTSGAPSFMRDNVNQDLAEILYEGDDLALIKHNTRHRFFPYNGQSPDEIAMNQASQFVSFYTKVLYANFDGIFMEIDIDDPGFWVKKYDDQYKIVQSKVEEYVKEIQAGQTQGIVIPFPSSNQVDPNKTGDTTTEEENPGEEDKAVA